MCSFRCIAVVFVVLTIVIQVAHLIEHSTTYGWSIDTATIRDVVKFCSIHLSLVLGLIFGILAIVGLFNQRSCFLLPFLICATLIAVVLIWDCIQQFPETNFENEKQVLDGAILLLKTILISVSTISVFLCFLEMRRFC